MDFHQEETGLSVSGIEWFSLDRTLDCGQCFRWTKGPDSVWRAAVGHRAAEVRQDTDTSLFLYHTDETDFETFWKHYFGLDRDISADCRVLCRDPVLAKAVQERRGIRILNQDPFETLISFLISQNNNIPRIRRSIESLCRAYGEPLAGEPFADGGSPAGELPADSGLCAFPTPERLAALQPEPLRALGLGYRDVYVIDAAQKVCSGAVRLSELSSLPLDDAEQELLNIKGVGKKVAQCVLLYGCGQQDAFPVDVWVRRVLAEQFPDGLPDCTEGIRGIAQQYLFDWRRKSPQFAAEKKKRTPAR